MSFQKFQSLPLFQFNMWTLSVFAGALLLQSETAHAAAAPLIIDLLTTALPLPTVLAVQVCAGLVNRNVTSSLSAYTIMHPEDWEWLTLVEPDVPPNPPLTTAADFIKSCLAVAAAGRVRYNFTAQQALIPNLLTMAAVLNGVPLEDGSPYLEPSLPVIFDAIVSWESFSPLNASEFVYDRYVNSTTTLAKMDPGYNYSHPLECSPPLSR